MNAKALSMMLAASLLAAGCGKGEDPAVHVPATSDPAGKDLVAGAVVAAVESTGGVRLLKIIHVDDYPEPIGYELHFIGYDPKGKTFEEAAKIWQRRNLSVVNNHFEVRLFEFMKRDHRVIAVEPVTDAEREPYLKAKNIQPTVKNVTKMQ